MIGTLKNKNFEEHIDVIDSISDNIEIVKNVINTTSSNISKILIKDEFTLFLIKVSIMSNLDIQNKILIDKATKIINEYINNFTQFEYDKSNGNIIGVVLEEDELNKFIKKLFSCKIEDEYIKKITFNNKQKKENLGFITILNGKVMRIDEKIKELNIELFRCRFYKNKNEGEIKCKIFILDLKRNSLLSQIYSINKEINKIEQILQGIEQIKANKLIDKMSNIDYGLMNFSFPYKPYKVEKDQEKEEEKDQKEKIQENYKNSSNFYRKGKKIIYSLAFFVGISFLLQEISSINNNKILIDFEKSIISQNILSLIKK